MRITIPFALLIVLLLAGCVKVTAFPAIIVYEHGFAKQVRGNGSPVDETTNFTQDDMNVYSYVKAGFYSAQLTWKWYDPSGQLYRTASYDRDCITIPCQYTDSLRIVQTPAATRFGTWRIELLADNSSLYSDYFSLRPIIDQDRSWFFDVSEPTMAHGKVTVRIHPQNGTWSNYRIAFGAPDVTNITAYEANTNRPLEVTGQGGDITVNFGGPRTDGYEFVLTFSLRVVLKLSTGSYFNLTWTEPNGIHPIPQKFVIAIPPGAALANVVGTQANYTVRSDPFGASRTSVSFNQTISPNQMLAFSVTYLMPQATTPVTILPSSAQPGGGSVFALRLPLVPLTVGDMSLWSAVTGIMLLVTSELVSPLYGRTGMVINRRRLRLAALLVAFIFLVTVGCRIYEIVLVT